MRKAKAALAGIEQLLENVKFCATDINQQSEYASQLLFSLAKSYIQMGMAFIER